MLEVFNPGFRRFFVPHIPCGVLVVRCAVARYACVLFHRANILDTPYVASRSRSRSEHPQKVGVLCWFSMKKSDLGFTVKYARGVRNRTGRADSRKSHSRAGHPQNPRFCSLENCAPARDIRVVFAFLSPLYLQKSRSRAGHP